MDGERFDLIAKRLAGTSRRGALRLLAGGALAAAGLVPAREAAAACSKAEGQRCRKTSNCCQGRCKRNNKCGCGRGQVTCDLNLGHTARCCPSGNTCCAEGCCLACDLIATLNGHNEVNDQGQPDQGDSDGTGTACVSLRTGEVCWDISVENIGAVTAAHIHQGAAGTNGPPVVDFVGQLSGCKPVAQSQIDAIANNPSGFYVNVHTDQHIGGAIRGQLGRAPG